jgi:hypothetical protein
MPLPLVVDNGDTALNAHESTIQQRANKRRILLPGYLNRSTGPAMV